MAQPGSFKELLSIVARKLQEVDFRRKGNSFYIQEDNNWGIVNFQKSVKSTADAVIFTVTVGTASSAVLHFLGTCQSGVPRIDQCQWQKRLGLFFPEPSDTWWCIGASTSTSAVGKEIVGALLTLALPAMKTYMSDTNLRNLWSSGSSPGLTETERLRYLSVLLKLAGATDALNDVRNTLQRLSEGRPSAGIVALHLSRLDKVHNA